MYMAPEVVAARPIRTSEQNLTDIYSLGVTAFELLTGRLPPLAELDGYFGQSRSRTRVAYAASFDFVSWTVRRHGRDSLRRILRQAGSQPFPRAWEAALGAKVTVPTLDGKIRLTVPAGSQAGQKLLVRGKGLDGKTGTGDLYAVLKVVMPPKRGPDMESLWQQIAEKADFDPRDEWEQKS